MSAATGEPSEPRPGAGTADLARLARWLDAAFTVPGTRFRIGWDGILGLVPGLGDLVTTAPALWIVMRAMALGVPRTVAARMVGNILVEATVGVIPVVGDLFDFAWKANLRNIRLLERYQRNPVVTRRSSTAILVLGVVGLLVLVVLAVALALLLVTWLASALGIAAP